MLDDGDGTKIIRRVISRTLMDVSRIGYLGQRMEMVMCQEIVLRGWLFYLLRFRLEAGLYGIQTSDLVVSETLDFNVWTCVVLASVDDPCSAGDEEHYPKSDNAVVHVGRVDGSFGREDEEDRCED